MPSCLARLVVFVGHSRARNFILCSGIFIALLVLAATDLIIADLRADHMAHAKGDLRNLSIALAEQIDSSLQGVDLLQYSLMDRMRELGVNSPDALRIRMRTYEAHQDLAHRIAQFPLVAAFSVHDLNGRLINFSRAWPPPSVDSHDRDFIAGLLAPGAPQTFISEPQRSLTTGQWTLYFSRRMEAPDGTPIGIVLNTIFADYFEKFFSRLVIADEDHDGQQDASFTVYRDDGTVLARYPHADTKIGTNLAATQNYKRVLASVEAGPTQLTSVFDGKERLVIAQRVAHFPLLVSVGASLDAVLATWRLETRDLAVHACLRLIMDHQLAALGRGLQVLHQGAAFAQALVHLGLEEPDRAASAAFRPMERRVGIAEQRRRVGSVGRVDRNADAQPDAQPVAVDLEIVRDARQQALRELVRARRV